VDDLMFRSPSELAELVRTGALSATELVQASLERIDALEPSINAFTHIARDSALRDAAGISSGDQRPFAGVPIAVKDNRAVAGMPLTLCSDLYGDYTPARDAFFVRRLREAGFVIVGKTALPEMGILPTTESRRNGPTGTRGISIAPRVARAAARRRPWQPGWSRSPTATMAAARPGSLPRAAASSA
jgi:amidase